MSGPIKVNAPAAAPVAVGLRDTNDLLAPALVPTVHHFAPAVTR